jgi:RNA polymerase sigma factor (sigma-70 family)
MAGDRHTFAATLASRYSRRLKQFFSARVRNRADAADLAQEVYLRLLRIENTESIRSPESYLFTIASHTLHQYTLRRTAAPEAVDIDEISAELQAGDLDDPAVQAETNLRIDRLRRALAQLPPMEQAALLMHRFAGYSIEEIGKQLGVARPTAKKYLAKALVHCRGQEAI